MSVAIVDGQTLTAFVEDGSGSVFNKCMEEKFVALDVDGDGVLSCAELMRELKHWDEECIEENNIGAFEMFDADGSGVVDMEEFKAGMREMMLAVARGIGATAVLMALHPKGCLMKAVEYRLAIARS